MHNAMAQPSVDVPMPGHRHDANLVPKAFPADRVAEGYAESLHDRLATAKELVDARLMKVIEREIPREDGLRSDDVETVKRVIRGIEVAYLKKEGDPEQMVLNFGKRTSNHQREQLKKQVRSVVGVDPVLAEPYLEHEIDKWVSGNVARIETIEKMFFDELEEYVEQGWREGWSTKKIAKEIEDRFGVSESRAAFIARDQVTTLNGQMAKRRQQEIGVDSYVWRTSQDERVRKSHDDNRDKTFQWDNPPAGTGHPGEDYQCRCTAEPDLSSLTAGAIAAPNTDGLRGPRVSRHTHDSMWLKEHLRRQRIRRQRGYL